MGPTSKGRKGRKKGRKIERKRKGKEPPLPSDSHFCSYAIACSVGTELHWVRLALCILRLAAHQKYNLTKDIAAALCTAESWYQDTINEIIKQ